MDKTIHTQGKIVIAKNISRQSLELENELNNAYLKPEIKSKIKEEFEKSKREQLILLKENKQRIIDFLLYNKDSIRIEDLKIFEPVYKCYREKGNCHTCNSLANSISKNCNNDNHNYNKEVWLCLNHWQEYTIEKHKYQI
jgi:hypothetical protein